MNKTLNSILIRQLLVEMTETGVTAVLTFRNGMIFKACAENYFRGECDGNITRDGYFVECSHYLHEISGANDEVISSFALTFNITKDQSKKMIESLLKQAYERHGESIDDRPIRNKEILF